MPRTIRPVWRAGLPIATLGRPENQAAESRRTGATVIQGILIGCVTATPFWLVVALVLAFR